MHVIFNQTKKIPTDKQVNLMVKRLPTELSTETAGNYNTYVKQMVERKGYVILIGNMADIPTTYFSRSV